MKTILVATDFSLSAINAANYAADMALAINADMLLLHVYQIPVSFSEIPVTMTEEYITEDTEKELNKLKEQLIRKSGGKLNIQTEIRMGLYFYQALKTVCEYVKPYIVVMGSQGTTGSEHMFFGSHTVYAMKYLLWPLITVPPGSTFSSIKKIGLASDFDKVVSTTLFDDIKTLVNDFNAELHILNTAKKQVFNPDAEFESDLLEVMLVPLQPGYHFITNENVHEGIMDFAEKNHIDLLIVLPRHYGLLDNLFHKNHTKQLVLHCHVPVMALHQ